MKRNRVLLFGLFTFALVCASLTFVGSTYAKYTSEVTASDTIRAAKYEWSFDGQDEESLQASVYDLNFNPTHNGEVVIAPDFQITEEFIIKNEGETTLIFTLSQYFEFTASGVAASANNPVLLSAKLNGSEVYAANKDEITTWEEFHEFELAEGASATLSLTFDWPAGTNSTEDANDTQIGRDLSSLWTYKLKVVAVQEVGSATEIE